MFDNYAELCEVTMDIAIRQAEQKYSEVVRTLAAELADEMIDTAEEYESKATN